MIFNMGGGGGENVTAETNEYTSLLEQALTSIEGKVWVDKKGKYLWNKMTAEGGTFIEYVVSGDADAYPDGGAQDGYWYERAEGFTGVAFGTVTMTNRITETIVIPHNLGVTPSRFGIYSTVTDDTEPFSSYSHCAWYPSTDDNYAVETVPGGTGGRYSISNVTMNESVIEVPCYPDCAWERGIYWWFAVV